MASIVRLHLEGELPPHHARRLPLEDAWEHEATPEGGVPEATSVARYGAALVGGLEEVDELLDGIAEHRSGNLDKVRAALEARGIEFLGDPITSPGVRLHKK